MNIDKNLYLLLYYLHIAGFFTKFDTDKIFLSIMLAQGWMKQHKLFLA